LLSGGFDGTITIAAVNWPIATRGERHLGVFSAGSAGRRIHLARATAESTGAFVLPGLTAGGASFGFVGVAFGLEKFLILGAENECDAAVCTLDGLVFKTHCLTSSLKNY